MIRSHTARAAANLAGVLLGTSTLAVTALHPAQAASLAAGNLFITSSRYAGKPATVTVGQTLPNRNTALAVANGSYPNVFLNDSVDGNFGITAPITLGSIFAISTDQTGVMLSPVTSSLDVTSRTGIVTSFASKSELGINLSTDGKSLTFMGYDAPLNALDVSNTDTPQHVDPTNSDTAKATARAVVQVDINGRVTHTDVNAYSGNNGRAAVLVAGARPFYAMVGNAGNGSGTEPLAVASNTGVQAIAPHAASAETTVVGAPQGSYGSKNGFQYGFAIQSLGLPADKSGKDDNFRGLTLSRGALYVSKGSGGNGVDTVYRVTPGPTPATAASAASITILPGFPTTPASGAPTFFPFGIWFADATTLYVADEGLQGLAADPNAGLQKWIFNGIGWKLAYVLQNGLALGQSMTIANYPAAYAPATTGLRNLTGHVDGKQVTLFAATATFSTLADPGADPNAVVEIVDQLDATSIPAGAKFTMVRPPLAGTVYRGVAYVPCATVERCITQNAIIQR